MAASLAITAAAAAAVQLFGPCGPDATSCNTNGANFTAGCTRIGGAVVQNQGLPNCALRGGSQWKQCGGVSCFGAGATNFSVGCTSLNGFISGDDNGWAYCVSAPPAGPASGFTACPPAAGTCFATQTVEQFVGNCSAKLGGFMDGFLGGVYGSDPECLAPATVVSPCGTALGGCAPAPGFEAACGAAGGFVTATVLGGIPVCALPGGWTTWQAPGVDSGSFATACTSLGGIVGSAGVCLLPCPPGGCAGGTPASISSASPSGTPSTSPPPTASAAVTTTPLPSRSSAAGRPTPGGALAAAVAGALLIAAAARGSEW